MSGEEKNKSARITAPSGQRPPPPSKFGFPKELLDSGPASPLKTISSADLRNAAIEQTMLDLENLEKKFRDGDPVREAITAARRLIATRLAAPAPARGAGLKAAK